MSYVLSWCNFTFELASNDVSDVVVRRRKVALYTSSHLTPTEAWRSPDSTTSEDHRVSSEVLLGNCTQVLGLGQTWRAWDSRSRKNSTSHLFWLVQTCLDQRTIQWPCTPVSQCHFLHFRTLLFFSLTCYPGEIAYLNSLKRELSNDARLMELYAQTALVLELSKAITFLS